MPTQEERLTTLEQAFTKFQKETTKYIQEVTTQVDFVQLKLRQFSLPAWRDRVVQEFFVHRAEKTTYKKFETA